MTFWLLFLALFPAERCELTYTLSGAASGEVRVTADGEQFRLDYPGGKAYFWNGKALQTWNGAEWSKAKGVLYAKENFPLALFLDTEKLTGFKRPAMWTLLGGKLGVEATFDDQGLAQAVLLHTEWGTVTVKRTAVAPIAAIADGTFPAKKGLLSGMSGLKGMMGMGDQSEVSATASARGVGEEANMDKAKPDYAAVDQVKQVAVTSSEVDAFAKAGGLK
jgi:hypothetical protein